MITDYVFELHLPFDSLLLSVFMCMWLCFYRAMHCIVQRAVLRLHVVCPFVSPWRWWIRATQVGNLGH